MTIFQNNEWKNFNPKKFENGIIPFMNETCFIKFNNEHYGIPIEPDNLYCIYEAKEYKKGELSILVKNGEQEYEFMGWEIDTITKFDNETELMLFKLEHDL